MTPPAGKAERARSFGANADGYNRYRPSPPENAVSWFLPTGTKRGVDLGAGTGALTEIMARRVERVVAVEPDRRMLGVLGRRVPSAYRVVAPAEAIPLRPGWADVVTASSAWHWMDPAQVVPAIAAVLRPGGILAVLWSGPDRQVPWVADVLAPARDRSAPPESGSPASDGLGENRRGSGAQAGRLRRVVELPAGSPFSAPENAVFTASIPYRVDDLAGLAASYSGVITLPEKERQRVRASVGERVAASPLLAGRQEIYLPLRCSVWRSLRLRER